MAPIIPASLLTVWAYTLVSVLVISAVSLVGLFTLSISERVLRKGITLLVSFAAGALLGDVFIHILPEAIETENLQPLELSSLFLAGILAFFLLEKLIHWRHCHVVGDTQHPHPFAIVNLVGDAGHNIVDGMIIAASYFVSIPVGIATTVAVFFHEIPQEIGDFGVLLHGGYSRGKALFMNVLSALGAVVGALIVLLIGARSETAAWYLLPLAAGGFIYIACADLFPELHKESTFRKSILQLIMLALGIFVMYLLLGENA